MKSNLFEKNRGKKTHLEGIVVAVAAKWEQKEKKTFLDFNFLLDALILA